MLTNNDKDLIKQARTLVKAKNIKGGAVKEVGCALVTVKGKIFKGVSIDVFCGIGFCAEHSAVAAMITQTNETRIKTIVAVDSKNIISPCGRCRELISLIDEKNSETDIIISENKKVKLLELLPFPWKN
jgi:cytidine deaminase